MTLDILEAKIFHHRLMPRKHSLNHDIFYTLIDIDNLESINQYWGFSYNQSNLWSIKRDEYFVLSGDTPRAMLDSICQEKNIPANKIYLMTVPRFLGHSFNPVSFFFIYDAHNYLVAVLSEVHNTFKEKHCYLSYHDNHKPIEAHDILRCEKVFHVSPFFPVSGYYEFQFDIKSDYVRIKIDYFDENQKMLSTGINAKRKTLSNYQSMRLSVKYPFIGIKILFLIHYHAVILWLKKIRFFTKPKPPSQWLSF